MSEFVEENHAAPAAGGKIVISASEWLLLIVLAAVQFTHIVDFMIIMPLGPEFMTSMHLDPEQFGGIVAAYTVSAGLASLFAASFLDRFDRKSALLFLYGGFIVGTLLCAAAPTYVLLLAARTVAGAFGGVTAAVVLAIVGDVFADARRGTATGVVMNGFSIATIAGVPLGLLLSENFGRSAPFVALGMFGIGMLALAAVILPPLRGHIKGADCGEPCSVWRVAFDPNHIRAFLLMLGLVASSFVLVPFIATFLRLNVGMDKEAVKYVYLCGGLTTFFTLPWIGRLADRYGKLHVFRFLAAACLIPFLSIPNLPHGAYIAAILLSTTSLFVITSGRMVPAMALITNASAPAVRGSFMSLNSGVQQLGAGVASYLGGVLLSQAAEDAPLVGYPLAGLVASGFALATVFLAGLIKPAPGGAAAPDSNAMQNHEPMEKMVLPTRDARIATAVAPE